MQRNCVRASIIFIAALLSGCGQSENGDAYVDAGRQHYTQREFAEAITQLEKALPLALERNTKSDVFTIMGNCYYELGEYDRSLENHDKAISEDPGNYHAYVNKGVVCRLIGKYDEAAELYSTALEMAPDYPELHASMGALAVYQEDYEAAISHLERAIALDDSLATAHSNLALALASVGRFDEADAELKQAVLRGYRQPEVVKERIDGLRQTQPDAADTPSQNGNEQVPADCVPLPES